MVARDDLLALLHAVQEAGDPAAVLTQTRAPAPSCRSLRQLITTDLPQVNWETLPAALTLTPGEVRLTFTRVEELAAALAALASLLERELEEFAARFELRPEVVTLDECEDVSTMMRDLEAMEAARREL